MGEGQTMISGPAFELTQVPRRLRLAPVREDRRELLLGGLAIGSAVPPEQELDPPTPRKRFPEWQERLPKGLGALPKERDREVEISFTRGALGLSKSSSGTPRHASSTGLVRESELDPAIERDAVFLRGRRREGTDHSLVDLRIGRPHDVGRDTVEMLERRASVADEKRDPTEEHRAEDLVTCTHLTDRAARHIEERQRPLRALAGCEDQCLQQLMLNGPERLATGFLYEPEHRVPVATGEHVPRLIGDDNVIAETVTARVGEHLLVHAARFGPRRS